MKALQVVAARGLTMVIGLVCGFLTTNLVITDAGVSAYALYSFLVAVPALIPFTDLGAGAALVNRLATSSSPDSDESVRLTMLSIFRILTASALVLVAVNSLLYFLGWWDRLLGSVSTVENADGAAFLCVMIFALSVPFSIGSRIFLGLQKAHVLVLLQGLQAPITLGAVFVTISIAPSQAGALLSLCAYVSLFVVALAGLFTASRVLPNATRWSMTRISNVRAFKGSRVMDIGRPLLLQTIAAPVATQLGRFILAQTVTAASLAMYGVASQVFLALQGLISMAGLTLWPLFAKQKANGERVRPFAISAVFALGAAACAAVVCVFSGPFFALVSGGKIEVSFTLLFAFSGMLVVQAALYPLGMFLMDAEGARFQTVPVVSMVVTNVLLSVVLSHAIGVEGPIIATIVATTVCQIIPYCVHISKQLRRP
jgi:O-antigen/teichoic acid export membrane protein